MHDDEANVSDRLANERTYLACARTSIAIIALGFVVARFGLFLREIGPRVESAVPIHFSSTIGVSLVFGGRDCRTSGTETLCDDQERIRMCSYEPTALVETAFSLAIFVFAVLIIGYLLLSS